MQYDLVIYYVSLVKTFGTSEYEETLSLFLKKTKSRLASLEFLAQEKDFDIYLIQYGNKKFKLSFGTYNELHKAINWKNLPPYLHLTQSYSTWVTRQKRFVRRQRVIDKD